MERHAVARALDFDVIVKSVVDTDAGSTTTTCGDEGSIVVGWWSSIHISMLVQNIGASRQRGDAPSFGAIKPIEDSEPTLASSTPVTNASKADGLSSATQSDPHKEARIEVCLYCPMCGVALSTSFGPHVKEVGVLFRCRPLNNCSHMLTVSIVRQCLRPQRGG